MYFSALIDLKNIIVNKLTFKKVYNGLKVLFSYYKSLYKGQPYTLGMPFSLSLEPTTSCNLRCPECPSGLRSFTRPTGMLDPILFDQFLEQVGTYLVYLTFYFQGEPFLNPKFLEMVKKATDKGIYTATSTNGHYLTSEVAKKTVESGLDRVIISIDGTSQEVYQQYRKGGNMEKVVKGAKEIIYWKKQLKSSTPFVIFQFLVVKPNEHQIPEVYKLAKEIGVDKVLLKTAQIYDYKNGSPLIPDTDKYSRYRRLKDGTYEIKNSLDNGCWRMWNSAVMTWDGQLVPCAFDKDAQHSMGKFPEKSFKELWKGDAYQAFRKKLFHHRSEIDICKNCSEGTKVWS